MKKIFTLIAMAFVAMSVNAQTIEETDPTHLYPIKSITWKPITWKNSNAKTDINDKDQTKLYFVKGTGNGYERIMAEEIYTDDEPTGRYRACYGYTNYEGGATGLPGYGLYYKFTPTTAGTLKVQMWINKGDRNTLIVKGSTGAPYGKLFVDYKIEGYVNGQKANYETPAIDPETGQQKVDNEGNPVYEQYCIFFDNDALKTFRENRIAERGKDLKEYALLDHQAFWGWISFDVEANESYYIFQQSSQLGFGGYEFTPVGGTAETYIAATESAIASEFAAVVDGEGVVTDANLSDKGSVVAFSTANLSGEAVASADPDEVIPDLGGGEGGGGSAISTVKADAANAIQYNMTGQQVSEGYKGIVIQNGKKILVK